MLALAAGLVAAAAQAQNLSIATGGTGGVYYPMGGGMAAVLSKYVPGMQATAEVTGGSVANLQLIGTGKPYIGAHHGRRDARRLQGPGQVHRQAGGRAHADGAVPEPHARGDRSTGTGITKMADLKGKRVSTGSGGSATEVMAFRVIEAAGLDKDKDMTRERLGVAESVNALKDRKIDAFFWVGGLPTAAVTDLANTPGVTIKMIDHADLVPAMNKKYGNLYVQGRDPRRASTRAWTADNHQATVMNLLVAHQNMDDKTAYNIVKTMFDKRDELIRVHKEAENIKLENQKTEASLDSLASGRDQVLRREGHQDRQLRRRAREPRPACWRGFSF